ncbi:MAG TPA: hypothetical protein VMG08_00765 [Allosphingosinicella sp.]|nr:hypothetical protein [Allosphingosinicella sp.]
MAQQQILGMWAEYGFERAEGGALLRLVLRFDPVPVADVAPPLVPEEIALHATCAPAPLTLSADGTGIGRRVAGFVAARGALGATASLALEILLPRSNVAALPADLFALEVALDLGAGGRLVAAPGLPAGQAEALREFAAAFEAAWRGLDGAGGTLKLAARQLDGAPALWCARASATGGIGLAATGAPPSWFALPPLAKRPIEGGIVDPVSGEVIRYIGVDLDQWWAAYVAAVERLAAAAAAASPAAADSLAATRALLAQGLAARLAPIGPAVDETEEALIRAVFAQALAADLACTAAFGLTVSVGRGAAEADPALVLHGGAITPIGAGGGAAPGPAAISLAAGLRQLAIAIPPAGDGPARRAFAARFEAAWLEDGTATAPLHLLLPGEADFGLGEIGPLAVPQPLPASAPIVLEVRAVPGVADAATMAEALAWALEADLQIMAVPGDRLELALAGDVPAPAAWAEPGNLFDALAHFLRFEAGRAEVGGTPEPGQLDRAAALAAAVAEALPRWEAPDSPADAAPLPDCRYRIDFEAEALSLTRCADASGALPPWPTLAGYARPTGEGTTGRYLPVAPVAPLRLSMPGFRLPDARAARLACRVRRNLQLAGTGITNPAFIQDGPVVASPAVTPRLDWAARAPDAPDRTLAAGLDRIFAPLGDSPTSAYGLEVEVELHTPLGDGIGTDFPVLLLPPIAIGPEAERLADLKARLASAIADWWRRAPATPEGTELRLTLTLLNMDEPRAALARFSGLSIPLPADPAGWWDPAPALS